MARQSDAARACVRPRRRSGKRAFLDEARRRLDIGGRKDRQEGRQMDAKWSPNGKAHGPDPDSRILGFPQGRAPPCADQPRIWAPLAKITLTIGSWSFSLLERRLVW